ncbi:MAG TPA: DUF4384 domain-containing protein [Geobacteraceae bacterium]|nr:DUF4384 domain-containing protein [Geobacteraceae bacterium]
MQRIVLFIALLLLSATPLLASQSVILDTDGYACMGDDKSRKQTEDVAFKDAKRKASESATTYIQAETHLKDAVLEKDILSAYTNSQVKVIQEFLKEWYQEGSLGDCYRVKLKVEVIPDEQSMKKTAKKKSDELIDNPAAPLSVKVWSDKPKYANGEKIRVFVKGNRPFYGRVVYQDASGGLIQILPNPYRQNSYFNGGTVYEIPSGEDKFDLEVAPPFGAERITLYASTSPMGEVNLSAAGGVYTVKVKADELATGTRGIKFVNKGNAPAVAEFAESNQEMTTSDK